MTKLVIVHPGLYTSANEALTGSFASDVIPIRYSDGLTKDAVLSASTSAPITHIAFLYHYPGYDKLPFFPDVSDTDGKPIETTYRYFSNAIIDIIKSLRDLNSGALTVDILTCDLKDQLFKEEVAKVEEDLGVDIRYSVDKTGNASEGGNWVLESDGVNVRELYFTEGVLGWKGLLTIDIAAAIKAGTYSSYITWNSGTYTVQQSFSWVSLGTGDGDSYIGLNDSEIFDGNGKTIDITGYDNWQGLFSTLGNSLATGPIIKNLGILNGTLGSNGGFVIRQSQNNFTVNNCYSTGTISNSGGGIAGTGCGVFGGSCAINYCYTRGDIIINSGGIIGSQSGFLGNCTISNCYSIGLIGDRSGGIAGSGAGIAGICTITNCYSIGAITGIGSDGGGGIVGNYAGTSSGSTNGICTITNCYSTGATNPISGGIAGSNSVNCIITNCVSNSPTIGSGTATITNSSTDLSSINASIYGWSPSVWKTGATVSTVSGYALPILKAFQFAPWVINSTATDYYTKATDSAKFAIQLPQDLSSAIKAGQLLPYISWNAGTSTYKLLQSFAWSILPLSNPDSYIALAASEIFDGNSFTIDISGFNSWAGLFTTDGTSLATGSVVKSLGILNGATANSATANSGGFIIRINQSYFTVNNCYSTGDISNQCGGIAGANCGVYGECVINNCYSSGNINYMSGGIVGISAGYRGKCTITSCYNIGPIGVNGGGIAGGGAGIEGICIINNCYSTNQIAGSTYGAGGGGIVGNNAGYRGNCTITNCYSIGSILDTSAGGIAGSNSVNCTITNCVSNSPTIGGGSATITGCSTNLQDINGKLYTGWNSTIWSSGGAVSGISLPILNAFRSAPWISSNKDTAGYSKATDAAQFAIVPYNLATDIKAGLYSTYITFNSGTYTVQKSFSWSALNLTNVDSYIGLVPGEIFDGASKTIDITGYNLWQGLFTSGGTFGQMGYTVKNLGILNGTTAPAAGFFIRGAQSETDVSYFTVQNCYSTGNIGEGGGGIAGLGAGLNGDCRIINCYSTGNAIATNSGGIVGSNAGIQGICRITSCYSTGTIGLNGGGIAGYGAGSRGQCIIQSCYNTAATIVDNCGGIVGEGAAFNSGQCTITDCYSIGTPGTNAGGIAGANAATGCTITNCVSNSPTIGSGAAQTPGCSTSIQDINGTLYTNWANPNTFWKAGTDIDGDGKAYPLLLAFQSAPFISVATNTNYYNKSSKAAQFSTAASAPTITSVQPGDTTLEVVFTAPTNDGGGTITNYAYSTNNGSTWTNCNPLVTASPITITGLTNGQTYQVVIRAINAQGGGLQSNMLTGTPSPQTPSAPTITSIVPGINELTVNFNPPTSTGGYPITRYEYTSNSGSTWLGTSWTSPATNLLIGGLVNGQTYNIQIRAVNSALQNGVASNIVQGTPATVPSAPTNLVTTPGNGQLSVTFTPGYDGGSPITRYEYAVNTPSGTWTSIGLNTNFVVSGLTNGRLYTIYVRGVNSVGTGFNSSVQGIPVGQPSAPTIAWINPINQGLIVGFTPANSGGSPITTYEYTTNGSTWTAFGIPSPLLDVTIPNLINGQTYPIQIRAVNNLGNGTPSAAVNGTPAPDLAPAIKAGAYSSYILWNGINAYIIVKNFAWTELGVQEGSYIGLLANEIFDGKGKVINLAGVNNWYGLFTTSGTSIINGSMIKNIGIIGGSTTSGNGFIVRAAQQFFTVENCYSTGAISGDGSGGIAGSLSGYSGSCRVINCYSQGTIGGLQAGGIVGGGAGCNTGSCTISSCYSLGAVQGSNSGGIVGAAVGYNSGSCIIQNCYSLGAVQGQYSGGITGVFAGSNGGSQPGTCTLINCYAAGLVTSSSPTFAAGLFGYASIGTATNCVSNAPFFQLQISISTPGCTSDFTQIDGKIYTNWDPAIWASGTVAAPGIYKLPILKGFLSLPWISDTTNTQYYNITNELAQFARIPTSPFITNIASGNTQLTVTYTPPLDNGGAPITSYQYSITAGTSWVTVGLTGSFTIPNLINGQQYTVMLRAINGVGTGLSTQGTGTPIGAPYAPTITSIISGNAQLTVNFTPGSNGGSVITGYQYSTDNGTTFINANTTVSPITITGLVNGQTYQVVIRAVNALGEGAVSNMVTGKPVTTPSAPTIISILAGDGSLTVEFIEAGSDGGSFITDYQYSIDNGTTFTPAGTDQSPIAIIGLTNGQTYPVKIRAVNAIGVGAPSAAVNGTPVAPPPPPPDDRVITGMQPPVGGTAENIEALIGATGQTATYDASADVARRQAQTERNYYDQVMQAQGQTMITQEEYERQIDQMRRSIEQFINTNRRVLFPDDRTRLSYKVGALKRLR